MMKTESKNGTQSFHAMRTERRCHIYVNIRQLTTKRPESFLSSFCLCTLRWKMLASEFHRLVSVLSASPLFVFHSYFGFHSVRLLCSALVWLGTIRQCRARGVARPGLRLHPHPHSIVSSSSGDGNAAPLDSTY